MVYAHALISLSWEQVSSGAAGAAGACHKHVGRAEVASILQISLYGLVRHAVICTV